MRAKRTRRVTRRGSTITSKASHRMASTRSRPASAASTGMLECMLPDVARPPRQFFDPELETLDRRRLADHQLRRLRALLAEVLPANPFYARKLGGAPEVRRLE